ncbi:MAG: tRNA lysidine(34) synthetase TilS [Ruminococcus sp.]|nr:tRNA lysidine(34) synthetase TilS [Ruminococcus sp.]
MNKLVKNTINKYNMINSGDKIIVALSGGADSVSLLHMLCSIKEEYDISLFAAHINHNLRGDEANRDEEFCKAVCQKLNIELFVKSVDVRKLAKQNKISEELCGRNVRYAFFEELSKKLNAKIATAHTASDNAETLIFNITRGSSINGISAIPAVRDNIIRPLIEVDREQIEAYCNDNDLQFVTDSSNLEDEYTRNKIRHAVIPVLKSLNPKFERTALNLSENAAEIYDYIDLQTKKALDYCKTDFGYDCKRLLSLEKPILKNAVFTICKNNNAQNVENVHINLIIQILKTGGAISLGGNATAVVKQNVFRIVCSNDVDDSFCEKKLEINSDFVWNNKLYSVQENTNNSNKETNSNLDLSIDLSKAVFRLRQAGDKFTYPKRKITKPLRKALNEMKIPSELRDKLVVLAVENQILWCECLGVSFEGECKDNSLQSLKIVVTDL